MKRAMVLVGAVAMVVLLSAGLALAATYNCTAGRACIGTGERDTLNGSGGSDPYMDGRQGDDKLVANAGSFAHLQGDAFDPAKNNTKTDGDDLLKGGPGFDEMIGYGGADTFWAEPAVILSLPRSLRRTRARTLSAAAPATTSS